MTSLDIIDPRLPTRVARPPLPKFTFPTPMTDAYGRKRLRHEDWGGMKFFCSVTSICTASSDQMRKHMEGDLYKRMAAASSTWEDSQEKKTLMQLLEEAETYEAAQKKAKTTDSRG